MSNTILELFANGGIVAVCIFGLAIIIKYFYNYVTIKDNEKKEEIKERDRIYKESKKEIKEIYEKTSNDYMSIINKFGDDICTIKKELKKINSKLDNN